MKYILALLFLFPFGLYAQHITYTKIEKTSKVITLKEGNWVRYRDNNRIKRMRVKRYNGIVNDSLIVLSKDTILLSDFVFCSKKRFLVEGLFYGATYVEFMTMYLPLLGVIIFNDFDDPDGIWTDWQLTKISAVWIAGMAVILSPNYMYMRSLEKPKFADEWEMEIGE